VCRQGVYILQRQQASNHFCTEPVSGVCDSGGVKFAMPVIHAHCVCLVDWLFCPAVCSHHGVATSGAEFCETGMLASD
jgi:hypothetical protein